MSSCVVISLKPQPKEPWDAIRQAARERGLGASLGCLHGFWVVVLPGTTEDMQKDPERTMGMNVSNVLVEI